MRRSGSTSGGDVEIPHSPPLNPPSRSPSPPETPPGPRFYQLIHSRLRPTRVQPAQLQLGPSSSQRPLERSDEEGTSRGHARRRQGPLPGEGPSTQLREGATQNEPRQKVRPRPLRLEEGQSPEYYASFNARKDTKLWALQLVRSHQENDAQKAANKALKDASLPEFKRGMQQDQVMRDSLRRARQARGGYPYQEPQYYKMTNQEMWRMERHDQPTLTAEEQARRNKVLDKAAARLKQHRDAAAQLHAAGIPTQLRYQPPGPPRVLARPRANPNAFQNFERQAFFASDWKLRQAADLTNMRRGNTRLAAASSSQASQGLAIHGNPHALRWGRQPWGARSAEQIQSQRERLALPRSLSDMTRENTEEHGVTPPLSPIIREARSQRGMPSALTMELKAKTLIRSHSYGHPLEITADNHGSGRVNEFRSLFHKKHASEWEVRPNEEGRIEADRHGPGRYTPVPQYGEDLIPHDSYA